MQVFAEVFYLLDTAESIQGKSKGIEVAHIQEALYRQSPKSGRWDGDVPIPSLVSV